MRSDIPDDILRKAARAIRDANNFNLLEQVAAALMEMREATARECAKTIAARKAVYEKMLEASNIAVEPNYNRWEMFRHTVEALEILDDEFAARFLSPAQESKK